MEQANVEALASWVTPGSTTGLAVRARPRLWQQAVRGSLRLQHIKHHTQPCLLYSCCLCSAAVSAQEGVLGVCTHMSSVLGHGQAADLGGGSCVVVCGHESGQLCRLRLTVPQGPGAAPSQVRKEADRRTSRPACPSVFCFDPLTAPSSAWVARIRDKRSWQKRSRYIYAICFNRWSCWGTATLPERTWFLGCRCTLAPWPTWRSTRTRARRAPPSISAGCRVSCVRRMLCAQARRQSRQS